MNAWIIFAMIFCHIFDDYYLQGILASMKQKDWWEKQVSYCDKYKHDYKVALLMHSFSWTFMIMLPLLLAFNFKFHWLVSIIFGLNVLIHALVDNLKANKKKINLLVDQSIHLYQIVATAFFVPLAYLV